MCQLLERCRGAVVVDHDAVEQARAGTARAHGAELAAVDSTDFVMRSPRRRSAHRSALSCRNQGSYALAGHYPVMLCSSSMFEDVDRQAVSMHSVSAVRSMIAAPLDRLHVGDLGDERRGTGQRGSAV